jgi:hypothetical protein
MRMGAESHETGRLPGEDEMSNNTSVMSSAEGPPTHEPKDKRVEEEMANPESTITVNPNLAGTCEMVITYINESEDIKKNAGDGMRAIRRHGGTSIDDIWCPKEGFQENQDFAGC